MFEDVFEDGFVPGHSCRVCCDKAFDYTGRECLDNRV
jgi:hypothetical protein